MLADIVLDGLEKSPDYKGKTRNDIIADEINKLKKKGRSHTEADAISEIVARACEDLLAGSKEAQAMFKSLSPAEQKTFVEKIQDLIQKVIDWIDEFLSSYVNQSNSAEAKALREDKERLEAMQILWDKMLREVQAYNKATEETNSTKESSTNDDVSSEGDVKFSEREIIGISGKNYGVGVYLDSNLLTGLNETERKQMVKEYVVTELAGKHFIAYDNNVAVDIGIAKKNDKIKKRSGKTRQVIEELYRKNIDKTIKQEAVVLADELIENAKFESSAPAKYDHNWLDNNGKNNWDKWVVFIQEKNKSVWKATLHIANTANGEKILYDIDPIKKVEGSGESDPTTTNDSIPNPTEKVNTKFSDRDSEYMDAVEKGDMEIASKMVEEEAEKAFPNSKVRDKNGNLLKVYHGTSYQNGDFYVFDYDKAKKRSTGGMVLGKGNYFAAYDLSDSTLYGQERIIRAYLNIKNPYIPTKKLKSDLEGTIMPNSRNMSYDEIQMSMKKLGYDGVIKYNDAGEIITVVAFDSNQIKSADPVTYDDKGNVVSLSERFNTENKDIRYSDRDYSYNELVSKPDADVIALESVTPLEEIKYKANYDLFAKEMRDIALKKGNPKNTEQKTYLHCKDLGEDILITRQSFKHGAARIDNAYISVCKSIADVLNSSIVVNELTEREKTEGAYVLLGIAENNNNYVVVRSIVNKKTWKLEEYKELYAIKKKSIKKRDVGLKAPALHLKSGYGTSPTVSISNFLDFVNSQPLGSSVLSLDVVNNLNSQRTFDENLTPNLKFMDREATTVYDLMGERDALLERNKRLEADVERLKKMWKMDKVVTHGSYFREDQIGAVARYLLKESDSTMDKVELMKQLKDAYSYISRSLDSNAQALPWQDVYERCQ